jgi:SulP family sulfate permease
VNPLRRWLPGPWPWPIWLRGYGRATLLADGTAALIVTVMLVPQSLAYALLAGLPAEVGLYASVVPLLLYALLGSSRVLAVGPVAVVSLMTAAAIGELPPSLGSGPGLALQAAVVLAALSGVLLLLMGALRWGFIANFLSHPVISGFISASGLLIALSQAKTLLGVQASGQTAWALVPALWQQLPHTHGPTLALGAGTLLSLVLARRYATPGLRALGLGPLVADLLSKAAPVLAIAATTALAWGLGLAAGGMKLVGTVPAGLPPLALPVWEPALWQALLLPALLISVVGFVESVSVGQTLAARRRQRIEPDQELLALGAANVGAAFTGGMPVTGGFARSIVAFDAGARTPATGVFTALGIVLVTALATPALAYLPQATLAATIVVAVLSLVDLDLLRRTWAYSRADFTAAATTLVATLLLGVESGLVAGVGVSLALHLLRTSRPHIAEVGLVPGTEHFRNVQRHQVCTSPRLLSLRVDESLYFANARPLEDRINNAVASHPELQHVVLQCSAVNDIDASALESLEAIEHRLGEAGIRLHFSELKGPVMDKLQRSQFLANLRGQVFLSHFQAVQALTPEVVSACKAG